MINHILVPLDGSELAECVLPHVKAIAPMTHARITLLHVLERNQSQIGSIPIDPLGWHMQKQESQSYLDRAAARLQELELEVDRVILEGNPAETIIEFARANGVDLIAVSSHGRTGLSEWNVSSVVQKILLRSYKSILLARAYAAPQAEIQYTRLFLAIDGSHRAEFILPFAMTLAQFHKSSVILGMVIQKPQVIQRLPLSEQETELINQFTEKNSRDAAHYLEQLATQLALKHVNAETNVIAAGNTIGSLYDMVDDSHADLVMLTAHGQSGERRWPYGSIAASLIAYGNTPLMILQDLQDAETPHGVAERAVREGKVH